MSKTEGKDEKLKFAESMKNLQEDGSKGGCLKVLFGSKSRDSNSMQEVLVTEIELLKATLKEKDATIRELNDRLHFGAEKFQAYLRGSHRQKTQLQNGVILSPTENIQSPRTPRSAMQSPIPNQNHLSPRSPDDSFDDYPTPYRGEVVSDSDMDVSLSPLSNVQPKRLFFESPDENQEDSAIENPTDSSDRDSEQYQYPSAYGKLVRTPYYKSQPMHQSTPVSETPVSEDTQDSGIHSIYDPKKCYGNPGYSPEHEYQFVSPPDNYKAVVMGMSEEDTIV